MTKVLGAILIVLGLIGLAWGGITYTTREKVVDLGPFQASVDKHHSIPVPPVAGGAALLAGLVVLTVGKRP